jgi:hypothetical protein
MVAAEATACGKPVAVDAASLPEVVEDGQTGYLPTPPEEFVVTSCACRGRWRCAAMGQASWSVCAGCSPGIYRLSR